VSDRETSLRPTPSDIAIVQGLDLGKQLKAPSSLDPESCRRPPMYINGSPAYVDGDDDVIYVEGPAELEPDTSVHGRETIAAPCAYEERLAG